MERAFREKLRDALFLTYFGSADYVIFLLNDRQNL